MKVLSVIDGSGWTGGVEQTLLLSGKLREMKIAAEIAAHAENRIVLEAGERGVPVHVYDDGGSSRFDRFGKLRRLLGSGYDVVVGHKPASVRHLVGPVYSRRPRPLFVGVRRVSFPVSPVTIYRFVDHLVAVSGSVREVLTAGGIVPDRVSVIPSGVETARFRRDDRMREETRRRLGLDGKTVLLNLAKFVPRQKGQDILFTAVSSLENREDIRLVLAGLDTDSAEAARLSRDFGLEKNVLLLGFRRDMPQLINAADVFVFPSLPGLDAIAGSVLQAMACERIVVSSRTGGIPEYLEDGRNGLLVEPGDAKALAGGLRTVMTMQKAEKERMGVLARKTVTAGYSTEAMAASYAELFGELLGKSR